MSTVNYAGEFSRIVAQTIVITRFAENRAVFDSEKNRVAFEMTFDWGTSKQHVVRIHIKGADRFVVESEGETYTLEDFEGAVVLAWAHLVSSAVKDKERG